MKAMVLESPKEMSLNTISDLKPKEGEVLIKTTHAGICGTDTKIYEGKIPANYPVIMGHEIVGEVVGGDTNEDIKNGMRVLVDPVFFCGKCFQCKIGNTNLCPFGGLMGRETNGGFAEYCVVKKNYIYPLPTGFDSKVGAAVQVLTTVLHAQNKGSIMEGDTVVILGLGVTGLMHIQLAKAKGAKLVIGVYVGMDNPTSLGKFETGSKTALPIFENFIKTAVKKSDARPFKVSEGITMMVVDTTTGQKASLSSKNTIMEAYKSTNVVNGKVLYLNKNRLDSNNILKFY